MIFCPKTSQFGQTLAFLIILAQIFYFMVHFGALPDHKTMGTRCLVGSLICEYQNFCSLSKKLGFWPENGQIGTKYAFLVILGQILAFLVHFGAIPDKKNINKTVIFAPKYAFLAHLLPCWLVVVGRGLYLARHLFNFVL